MPGYVSLRSAKQWPRLIGLVLFGILLWRVDVATIGRILSRTDYFLISVAVVLNLPLVWLKTRRWQVLMQAQDIHYAGRDAFLAYFGSIFIGFLTPGRLGEFVKVLHVSRDCNVSPGRAFSSVLVDRLFDLCLLLGVGGAALLSLTGNNRTLLALTGATVLLTLPLALFMNQATFNWLQRAGLRMGRLGQKMFAAGGLVLQIRRDLRHLTTTTLALTALLTVLAYLVFFLQCYLIALALGLSLGFGPVSFAVALGSLITLLPISISGLGTREAAIMAYLGTLNVAAEAAFGFALLVFLIFYGAGGGMGAIAWWLKPLQLRDILFRSGRSRQSVGSITEG